MGISTLQKFTCDFVKDGKPCGRTFLLPEEPEEPTPGMENVIRWVFATGQKLCFCSVLHAVAYGVEYIKASPKEQTQPLAARRNAPNPATEDLSLRD